MTAAAARYTPGSRTPGRRPVLPLPDLVPGDAGPAVRDLAGRYLVRCHTSGACHVLGEIARLPSRRRHPRARCELARRRGERCAVMTPPRANVSEVARQARAELQALASGLDVEHLAVLVAVARRLTREGEPVALNEAAADLAIRAVRRALAAGAGRAHA